MLSDEDYEKILKEKLLRLEAEIARVDEEIAKARAAEEARVQEGN